MADLELDRDTTMNTIASCLPVGVHLKLGEDIDWGPMDIAAFVALKLEQADCRVVYQRPTGGES